MPSTTSCQALALTGASSWKLVVLGLAAILIGAAIVRSVYHRGHPRGAHFMALLLFVAMAGGLALTAHSGAAVAQTTGCAAPAPTAPPVSATVPAASTTTSTATTTTTTVPASTSTTSTTSTTTTTSTTLQTF